MQIYPGFGSSWTPLIAATLIGAGGVGVFSLVREHQQTKALEIERSQTAAALTQARGQIQELSARLDSLTAAKTPPPDVVAPKHVPMRLRLAPAKQAARTRPDDVRLQRLQSQVSDQEKEIAKTREEIGKAQADLQDKLNSTRDDLNGSIAKNHEELVALQKRGERNYYEFDLPKSKEVRRVGSLSLALRKSDTKHKTYDLVMIVDDSRLEKKHVNLYEPVWVTLGDRPQPLELIVNQISKDRVQGYLSEPKYKKSELTETTSSAKPQQLIPR